MCHPEVPAGTVAPRVRTEEVAVPLAGAERMPALLALPETTPAAAVLVISDVFGRSPFYENLSRRLAQAGFVALVAEYFFREGPLAEQTREAATERKDRLDEARAVRDLQAAIGWLQARREVRERRIGTIGFCMGGTYVLDLASRRDDLRAGVSYYGFPAAKRAGLAPPVETAGRMRGSILGHWGDQDTGVGMENVEALRRNLEAAGVPHEFHIYRRLGHGFLKAFLEDESAPGYDRARSEATGARVAEEPERRRSYEAACLSWRRTLDFLRRSLG